MISKIIKTTALLFGCIIIAACSNKRSVTMKVHSDPLGAYAMMQVKHKGLEGADWIFLGPTPVEQDRIIRFNSATTISLKVIRPGFYEQTKSWKAKDFLKEYRRNKKIFWVPNMVQQ